MENEILHPVHAFTKEHDFIAPVIYTLAGISAPIALEDSEKLLPEDARIQWRTALWDTGATHTSISDRLAAQLDLEPFAFVEVATSAGLVQMPIYSVHFVLPSRLVFLNIQAIGFIYTDDDCDIIIGMDIMTQGDLSMTNMEGRTVFSFRIPSLHTLDFEAEHSE